MSQLKNLPNLRQLEDTLSSFLEVDGKTIQSKLNVQYPGINIDFFGVRFFRSFINQQASLFSQPFDRGLQVDTLLSDVLTKAEQEAERYLHIFKKAAIFIDYESDDIYESVTAIDPTLYFHDIESGSFFMADGDKTLFFNQLVCGYVELYTKDEKFSSALFAYDTDINIEEQGYESTELLKVMPLVEWSYDRILTAQANELVPLERNYIISVSWGIYNSNPKLVQHVVLSTEQSAVQVKEELLPNFGKKSRVTVIGTTDEFNVFDTGNINVMTDLMKVYSALITQRALQLGVDKNSIVVEEKVESGEAKKVALGYVNTVRNQFIFGAKILDRKVVETMEVMGYNVSDYTGISFRPLAVVPSADDNLVYAKNMMETGFWSFEQGLSYVLDISIDDAEDQINDLGLEPYNIDSGDVNNEE